MAWIVLLIANPYMHCRSTASRISSVRLETTTYTVRTMTFCMGALRPLHCSYTHKVLPRYCSLALTVLRSWQRHDACSSELSSVCSSPHRLTPFQCARSGQRTSVLQRTCDFRHGDDGLDKVHASHSASSDAVETTSATETSTTADSTTATTSEETTTSMAPSTTSEATETTSSDSISTAETTATSATSETTSSEETSAVS